MAYTVTDLERLRRAIASGRVNVKYEDRSVTYRSLDEMLRLESRIAAELGEATAQRAEKRRFTSYGKGL